MQQWNIAGILMAAGASSRMDCNKLFLRVNGEPMYRHMLKIFAHLPLCERVVVTRYPEIEQEAREMGLHTAWNDHAEQGISTTVAMGTRAIGEADGLMYFVCDQPSINEATCLHLMQQFDGKHVVIPVFGSRAGNPCIFPFFMRQALQQLQGDEGGRTVWKQHPGCQCFVSVEHESVLQDIDTHSDYLKFLMQQKSQQETGGKTMTDQTIAFFYELAKIPRKSGHEQEVAAYLMKFAQQHGLEAEQDEQNNVVIRKPASTGCENAPTVIIQGHTDMVCESAPDVDKDFLTEGIDVYEEDGWLKARGTSMGGDDGLAVAMALSILDDNDLTLPALECVFTTNEETGMDGANALDYSKLKGSMMLNLDTEEEGVFCISSAGGGTTIASLPIRRTKGMKKCTYRVILGGMLGGHSGVEIHKNRINGISAAGRVLYALQKDVKPELVSFQGGKAHNSVPNRVEMILNVAPEQKDLLMQVAQQTVDEICAEFPTDHCTLEWEELSQQWDVWDASSCQMLINFLLTMPTGVLRMSSLLENFVDLSQNIGTAKQLGDEIQFEISVRCGQRSAILYQLERNAMLTRLAGGSAQNVGLYPGWAYRENSPLRDTACQLFEEMYGYPAKTEGIHAGLECGYFYEALQHQGIDIISYGPNMKDIHSFHERAEIASIHRVYEFTVKLLERIARG